MQLLVFVQSRDNAFYFLGYEILIENPLLNRKISVSSNDKSVVHVSLVHQVMGKNHHGLHKSFSDPLFLCYRSMNYCLIQKSVSSW